MLKRALFCFSGTGQQNFVKFKLTCADLEFMENTSPSPADPVPGKGLQVYGRSEAAARAAPRSPPTTTTTSFTSQAAMFRSVRLPPDQGSKVKGRLCPGSVAQKVPSPASKPQSRSSVLAATGRSLCLFLLLQQ